MSEICNGGRKEEYTYITKVPGGGGEGRAKKSGKLGAGKKNLFTPLRPYQRQKIRRSLSRLAGQGKGPVGGLLIPLPRSPFADVEAGMTATRQRKGGAFFSEPG